MPFENLSVVQMFSVDHGAPGTVLSYNKEEYSGNINCIMHYDINE